VRKSFSNVGQVLKYNNVAVVIDGFRDDLVCNRMDVLFPPCFFALPKTKQSVVRGLRTALLHFSTPLLKLAAPVVVVVSLSKHAG